VLIDLFTLGVVIKPYSSKILSTNSKTSPFLMLLLLLLIRLTTKNNRNGIAATK
jgi:hypothetical protein